MGAITTDEANELFRTAPHQHLDVGNGSVAYRRVGTGPDVLFVHGWPVSGATFRSLLPHLTPHLTCHVIDMVGAGDSQFDRTTEIGIQPNIDAVQKVVDLLGLDDFGVVGHDSGGMIARHALAGDPRVRAMALVNTEQSQGLTWRFRQFLLMAKVPGFEHMLAWAAMQPGLRSSSFLLGDCFTDRTLLHGAFEELFLVPLRDDLDRRWAAGEFGRSFEHRYVHQLGALHERISVPVHLIWGEDDPFFPLAWTRDMVATFPDARLHVVPKAKLFVHEERPDAVADAMLPALLGPAHRSADD